MDQVQQPHLQALFRIFSALSRPAEINGLQELPVDSLQALIVRLVLLLPRPVKIPRDVLSLNEPVYFPQLMDIVCSLAEKNVLTGLLNRIFDRFIAHIIRKGLILYRERRRQRGCLSGGKKRWKTICCSVMPGKLILHGKEKLGPLRTIELDQAVIQAVCPDPLTGYFVWRVNVKKKKKKNEVGDGDGDGEEEHLFAEMDERRWIEWMDAMRLASEKKTRAELIENDRVQVVEQHRRLQSESVNVDYLESENVRLTRLLNEHKRALSDEEIVRSIASRMFDEEREKNEYLVELIAQLQSRLIDLHGDNQRLEQMNREIRHVAEQQGEQGKEEEEEEENRLLLMMSTQSI